MKNHKKHSKAENEKYYKLCEQIAETYVSMRFNAENLHIHAEEYQEDCDNLKELVREFIPLNFER